MNSYTDESGFDGIVPAHPIECERTVGAKPIEYANGLVCLPEGYKEGEWWGHIVSTANEYAVVCNVRHTEALALKNHLCPASNAKGAPELEEHMASAHLRRAIID